MLVVRICENYSNRKTRKKFAEILGESKISCEALRITEKVDKAAQQVKLQNEHKVENYIREVPNSDASEKSLNFEQLPDTSQDRTTLSAS